MTITGTKTKRPGRSFRRRQKRKFRSRNLKLVNRSASTIQKCVRRFLEQRYRHICPNNYDDHDYINLDKVSNIPHRLMITIGGTGYNALGLLNWFCCKQVDPVTRKPIEDSVPIECAAKILEFIKSDITFKKNKGHFKLRRKYTEAINKCVIVSSKTPPTG